MKAKPRRIERQVAKHLSRFYENHSMQPVKRIPVLGRTGPDIMINEAELVIDVKDRIEVPKGVMLRRGEAAAIGESLIGVRLGELALLLEDELTLTQRRQSKLVQAWIDHMDDWRARRLPSGISMVVLHRPHRHVANSTAVIYLRDWKHFWRKFNDKSNRTTNLSAGA
jgi:hypothetical protein